MAHSLNDINHAFFIGIGGVSMSSLASILIIKGKKVSGYDMNCSASTERLIREGAEISYDLSAKIPKDVDTIIYTAAVNNDNPLMIKAYESGAVILSRAELLGIVTNSFKTSVGVAGTHGKSTTTGLLSSVCLTHDSETAVLSGANLPFIGSSYKCADGERIVYEACEYKNSYHSMIPSIKVILNCEHDHVDFFPNIEDVIDSFKKFIDEPRYKGSENIAVVNGDCSNSVLAAKGTRAKVYTYSTEHDADFRAYDIDMSSGYGKFSVKLHDGKCIEGIQLLIPGIHNVSNSTAAAAAAYLSGVSCENIKKGLESFTGVSRRFEYLGTYNGAKIFDDYAHHPDEIEVTLKAAKMLNHGRIICVFQPHTYSRTYEMLDGFAKALSLADKVYLCPIYPAREINTTGVASTDICARMSNASCPGDFADIAEILKNDLSEGDYCITMGAGEAFKTARILLDSEK